MKVPTCNSPQHWYTENNLSMRLPQQQRRILSFGFVLLTECHDRVRSWLRGHLTRVWCQQFPVLDQVPCLCTDCNPALFLCQKPWSRPSALAIFWILCFSHTVANESSCLLCGSGLCCSMTKTNLFLHASYGCTRWHWHLGVMLRKC